MRQNVANSDTEHGVPTPAPSNTTPAPDAGFEHYAALTLRDARLFDDVSTLDARLPSRETGTSESTGLVWSDDFHSPKKPNKPKPHDFSPQDFLSRVLFASHDPSLLTGAPISLRLALRDVIAYPPTYRITRPWLLKLVCSFAMLIVLTMFNASMLNIRYLGEPYFDKSDSCFFAGPTIAVLAQAPNCALRNESYTDYCKRWINFVASATGPCANMLLAVGGGREESTPDVETDFFWIPDEMRGFAIDSSGANVTALDVAALSEQFCNRTCADPNICQRFILITQQKIEKQWTHLMSRLSHYVVFVESSWRFVSTGCQRNTREIVVPVKSTADTSPLIAGWTIYGFGLVLTLVLSIFQGHAALPPLQDGSFRGVAFSRYIKTTMLICSIIVCVALAAAFLAPDSLCIIVLLLLSSTLCIGFDVLSSIRHWRRFWLSFQHTPSTAAPVPPPVLLLDHDPGVDWTVGSQQRDSEFVFVVSFARLILSAGCCLYFGVLGNALLRSILNLSWNPGDALARTQLMQLFDAWITQRSICTILHVGFAPVGLELVQYIPHWMGYVPSSSSLPRMRWLVTVYCIVFLWYPTTSKSLPVSFDAIAASVIAFIDQLAVDFGAAGNGQIRLGYSFLLLVFSVFFVQSISDLESESELKCWALLRCHFIARQQDAPSPKVQSPILSTPVATSSAFGGGGVLRRLATTPSSRRFRRDLKKRGERGRSTSSSCC